MNKTDIFNYFIEEFNRCNINYVVLHSYQNFPNVFESDIDIAIKLDNIGQAVMLLDEILMKTDWSIVQTWQHENLAVDCVISNNVEFLQVDFCINYERNGRNLIDIEILIEDRFKYKNFYVPSQSSEYIYILLKKILKLEFTESSMKQLTNLNINMSESDKKRTNILIRKYLSDEVYLTIERAILSNTYDRVDLKLARRNLLKKSSHIIDNLKYIYFELTRILRRLIKHTGLFVVILGVDGSGKTTISSRYKSNYSCAFRRVSHYHSRVRVLNDISKYFNKNDCNPVSSENPHSKEIKHGKVTSFLKFLYYYLDFLIGNFIITKSVIKSSLVIIERYYYDYLIDKVRYNLNTSPQIINFFGKFIKKPDVIFILVGNSNILYSRKKEITIEEIEKQTKLMIEIFKDKKNVHFIDTTQSDLEKCVGDMIKISNDILRGKGKW